MKATGKIRVWDIGVRVFHWSLVGFFFVAYFSEDMEVIHSYAGYAVAMLLAFRLIWGFVGPQHARFTDFVYGPGSVMQYLRSIASGEPRHYLGHNPLGGWMVITLLVALTVVTWSGLEAYAAEGHGPLAGTQATLVGSARANGEDREDNDEHDSRGDEDLWEELHEAAAELTLALVFIHVLGVLIGSAIHRENLIKAMITGYK